MVKNSPQQIRNTVKVFKAILYNLILLVIQSLRDICWRRDVNWTGAGKFSVLLVVLKLMVNTTVLDFNLRELTVSKVYEVKPRTV